jgi:4-amino-4-deoxy-L-arabinose transferase-like glycosyltransferase
MTEVLSEAPTRDELREPLTDMQPVLVPEGSRPNLGSSQSQKWWCRPDRANWSVQARIGIFGLATLLYTWNLGRVGTGNTYYAAAVRSGTESWKAFFFGSLDPGSFSTVDKPPAALWVMELSGRIFGFSGWSMLLPEAVAGVATVMVLYHLVRRWFGEPAAVLASLALALTPVAVVIFRYNNPDAFVTLLLVLAAWACWRAIESGKTMALVLSGALLGLAFLTKTLDAFIVVPALGLSYLWCAPPRLARRIGQLGWAGLALLVSSGWWVAVVEIWPRTARPYIGGSTDNSEFNLIFGYNGLSRISGSSTYWAVDGGQGLLRMFDTGLGGQISWFLPFAIVGVVGGLCLTRGRARTDLEWGGFVFWGRVFLSYFAVFDDARGIFHPYYTVVMAPAVGALAGAGAVALWRLGQRSMRWAWLLPATIVGTALWAEVLLARASGYVPWLGRTVMFTGIAAALVLFFAMTRGRSVPWLPVAAGVVAAASMLASPLAYSLTTVGKVTSDPATAGPADVGRDVASSAKVDVALVNYLEHHEGSAADLVAVTGSKTAAKFILLSGKPVIAMGGYTGLDPAPTLGVFEHLVATGTFHYVFARGVPEGARSGQTNTAAVDAWLLKHGNVVSPSAYGAAAGAWTLYDVSDSTAPGSRRSHPSQ